jgi:uncharacterized SAM-binding protein YcdF (DUF218 family)
VSGHDTAGRRPGRRRAALLVALGGGLLGLLAILGLAARVAFWTVDDPPFGDGPIVVLGGGGGERLATALALRGDSGRMLVMSADAVERYTAGGGSCEDDDARCFRPSPLSTLGEARTVGDLARTEAWPHVTVVTSDFHTLRTRLLFRRCVDVPVAVVAAPADAPANERLYRVVRESIATAVALVRRC